MITEGSENAPFVIIGEAPGREEEVIGRPFVGASGQELNRMLAEAGISRGDCFLCNVTDKRPPDNHIESFFLRKTEAKSQGILPFMGRYPAPHLVDSVNQLRARLNQLHPRVFIPLGGTALWALTGKIGITKWRGSELSFNNSPLIPTFHPADVLRNWLDRSIAVQDFRRAVRRSRTGLSEPYWHFLTRPSFTQAWDAILSAMEHAKDGSPLVCDIETRARQIACVGIGLSSKDAFCIPLMCQHNPEGYWPLHEEVALTELLRKLLTESKVIFQNGGFDCQYFAARMGFMPNIIGDTMLMQHIVFPSLPKSLAFIASMYCDQYVYWKDARTKVEVDEEAEKLWDDSVPDDQLWHYNCEDCARTYEGWEVLDGIIDSRNLRTQYVFQIKVLRAVIRMMLRGILIDGEHKKKLGREANEEMERINLWFDRTLGHALKATSPKQLSTLFYEDFHVKPIVDRKTGRPTLNEAALNKIAQRVPLLRPLCEQVIEYRSLSTLRGTFAEAETSADGRMRCTFNVAGTITFRFSSKKDVFGSGMNLQNIPQIPTA